MNLAPLLNASASTQFHAFAGLTALVLGLVQFTAPKGTIPHRAIGWTWIALMMSMLFVAFFIRDRISWSPFSPWVCYLHDQSGPWVRRCASIQLITIYFMLILPYAALYARRHEVNLHRVSMAVLMFGALFIATLFTFDTTRIMHMVLFGG
jgi:uncharacterized membrane protein